MNFCVVLSTQTDTSAFRMLASSRLRYAARQEQHMLDSTNNEPSLGALGGTKHDTINTEQTIFEPHDNASRSALLTAKVCSSSRSKLSLVRLLELCVKDYVATQSDAFSTMDGDEHPDEHEFASERANSKKLDTLLHSLSCVFLHDSSRTSTAQADQGHIQNEQQQQQRCQSHRKQTRSSQNVENAITAFWASTDVMAQQRRLYHEMSTAAKERSAATNDNSEHAHETENEYAGDTNNTLHRDKRTGSRALIYLDVTADLLNPNNVLVLTQLSSLQHALTTVATQINHLYMRDPVIDMLSAPSQKACDKDVHAASCALEGTTKAAPENQYESAIAASTLVHDSLNQLIEQSSHDKDTSLSIGQPTSVLMSAAGHGFARRWSLLRLEPTGNVISARVTSEDIREINHLLTYFSHCSGRVKCSAPSLQTASPSSMRGEVLERLNTDVNSSDNNSSDNPRQHTNFATNDTDEERSCHERKRGRLQRDSNSAYNNEHIDPDRKGGDALIGDKVIRNTTAPNTSVMMYTAAYVQLLSLVQDFVCMHCGQLPLFTLTMSCCSAVLCQRCAPTPSTVQAVPREDTMCPVCAEIPVNPPESHPQRDRKVASLVKELRVLYLPQLEKLRHANTLGTHEI